MVMFTATVTPNGSGNPTGAVTFFDGSTSIGHGTLSTVGTVTTATFSTSTLAPGTHTISASYNGDTSFASSSGSLSGGQIINNDPGTGNVTATVNWSGVLTITGESGNNIIAVSQVSPSVLQVAGGGTTVNGSSDPATFNSVSGVTISFQNGNDSVTLDSVTVSGSISITVGTGADDITLTGVGANLISITGTGADFVNVSGVTARNDLNITVGGGSQSVGVTSSRCLDMTIRAQSHAADNLNLDLENDTVMRWTSGGLTLDDSRGAGNDTATLRNLSVGYQLAMTLSAGTNTLSADHVTSLFGSIDGGSGGNNQYTDNGGNSGYSIYDFVGY